jgi:hypothetical protein
MAGASRMPWPRSFAWATTVAALAVLAGPTGPVFLAAGGLGLGAITLAVGWWSHRRSLREPARGAQT